MSNEKTYNGWTNYETWAVALWIDNEQGTHNWRRELGQECWNDAEATKYRTREEQARFTFADRLKDEMGELAPDLGATLWADLLGAALSEVNWQEIAGNWLEEVDREEEVDDDDEPEDE